MAELQAAAAGGTVPGRMAAAKTIEAMLAAMSHCLHMKAEQEGCMYRMAKCLFPEMNTCRESWKNYWAMKLLDADDCGDCLRGTVECKEALGKKLEGPIFSNAVLLLILLNTILLASERYGQSEGADQMQSMLNLVFTVIFSVELALKLFAFGWDEFFESKMNQFDAFVVFTSLLEIALSFGISLAGLRGFRLLRILRVARWLPGMAKQLDILGCIMMMLFNYLVVLALFVFLYAVMGVYLFGAKTGDDSDAKFDNFIESFITVFRLLSMDDWTTVMTICVNSTSTTAVLYFVSVIFLGNFILRSVFIAILLEAFAEVTDEEEQALVQEFQDNCDSHAEAVNKIKSSLRVLLGGLLKQLFEHWKLATSSHHAIADLIPRSSSRSTWSKAAAAVSPPRRRKSLVWPLSSTLGNSKVPLS